MAEQWPAVQGAEQSPQGSRRRRTEPAGCACASGRAGPDSDAALGIYAETYSPSTTARVSADGEILDLPRDSRTARAERFCMKSAANRLLPKDHRTTKCMRWRLPSQEIQVLKGQSTDKAFYHGLQVCSMPWTCPVCASKISERRRQEVAHGMKQAEVLGLQVFLLTLTVPHGMGDDVNVIVDKMMAAWKRLWQGKSGMQLREALGLFGHIRALEVTYGENGFHPHFHALLFFHPQQTTGRGWGLLPSRWQTVAVRSGLPQPSWERGCRIDGGEQAANYVTKGVWGLESEVTKGHTKTGKKGSRTPLDLLKGFMQGDTKAGALWRVYASAFEGKRQLYWSNGLKKLLSVAELSDEEIANKPEDEPALLLAQISDMQWKAIYRRKLESTILDLAETSPDAMRLFLQTLGDQ